MPLLRNRKIRRVWAALGLIFGLNAWAAPSIEDRLAELEANVKQLAEENARLRKELGVEPAPSTSAVIPAGKELKLTVGGFMQMHAEFGQAPDARWTGLSNRFFIRRARTQLTATYAESFVGNIETEFGPNGIGATSAARVQLTTAYIQWIRNPAIAIKVGQFSIPFGFEQLLSDAKLVTIERSLPNDRLVFARQIGVGVSGDLYDQRVSYSAGVFNGTGSNTNINDNNQFMWVGRVSTVLYEKKGQMKLSLGGSVLTNREDSVAFAGRRDAFAVDSQFIAGPMELQAEILEQRLQPSLGARVTPRGGSLLATYQLAPEWQPVARFETYESNAHQPFATTDVWTAGINYLIKGDDLKLSLNYLRGDQPGVDGHRDRVLARMQLIY